MASLLKQSYLKLKEKLKEFEPYYMNNGMNLDEDLSKIKS